MPLPDGVLNASRFPLIVPALIGDSDSATARALATRADRPQHRASNSDGSCGVAPHFTATEEPRLQPPPWTTFLRSMDTPRRAIMYSRFGAFAGLALTSAVLNCGVSQVQPPIDLGDQTLTEAGVGDATLPVEDATSPTVDGTAPPVTDASAPNDAQEASGDAAPPVGNCQLVGAPPTTCTPAHVTCTGEISHGAASSGASCTLEQINSFYDSCIAGSPSSCATYRASLADAGDDAGTGPTCLACLVTSESAPKWGPLVAASNGMLTTDVGGCSHDPTGTNACGRGQMTYEECLRIACAPGCGGDPADPVAEAAFQACEQAAAQDPQSCLPYANDQCPQTDYPTCSGGSDFVTHAFATMMSFCATEEPCIPAEAPLFALDPQGTPQRLHQNVCSTAQIDGFLAACDRDVDASASSSCDSFIASNGACGACLRTNDGIGGDGGPWGATVYQAGFGDWLINLSGCVIAASGGDASAPCAQQVWDRVSCDLEQCTSAPNGLNACEGIISPLTDCSQAADRSICAPYAASAASCAASLIDGGGDVSKCVTTYSTLEDAVVAMATLFCGP